MGGWGVRKKVSNFSSLIMTLTFIGGEIKCLRV